MTSEHTIARSFTPAGGIHFFKSIGRRGRRDISLQSRTQARNVIDPTNSVDRHVANANNFCR